MPDKRFIIRSITLQTDGVAIEYMRADEDVRASGLQHQHVVFIPRGEDYEDELDALEEAAIAALADALEDLHNTEPVRLSELELRQLGEDDDDDDEEDDEP